MRKPLLSFALVLGVSIAAPASAQTELKSDHSRMVRHAFSCPAPKIAFESADGRFSCLAPGVNPCPQGQALVKSAATGLWACKAPPAKAAFSCPAPQVVFQGGDGKFSCLAPDANPCPAGQALEKSPATGIAGCKPASSRTPLVCPPGQVVVQRPDGKFVCAPAP